VADAGSSDGTREIALGYRGRLLLEVIPGGLPAVGRNAGARLAASRCVLFLDADVELADRTLVRRALELMKRKNLHCVTTSIRCSQGTALDQALYSANNVFQFLSQFCSPFSTGMFMLFDKQRFEQLGGFHEQALFAEDYLLSKQVARSRFGLVRGHILTTNRRFRKMGHLKVVSLFLKTALNSGNEKHFLRDHKYWSTE